MLSSTVIGVVRFCTRFPWLIIVIALCATAASTVYCVKHFAINTDINKLISPDLDWRKREFAFEKDFPGHYGSTLVVVEAPTAELSQRAGAALAEKLGAQRDLFPSVENMAGSEFFARNGLLFQPTEDLGRFTQGLARAAPLVGTLVGDPSLRGLNRTLSLALVGVQNRMTTLDTLARPLSMAADTVEDALKNRPASFSWRDMLSGQPTAPADLRQFIEVHPVLDYSALEPGRRSSEAIRKAATDLNLGG